MRGVWLVALFAASGCATVGPPPASLRDAEGYAFESGWGMQEFAAPDAEIHRAAVDALADLQMTGIHREKAGEAVMLDARTHDGRHARVAIHRGVSGSVVAARIGRSGDDALARAFLNRVGVRLGTRPPEAISGELPETSDPDGNPGRFSREAVPDAVMLPDQAGSFYRDSPTP